MTKPRRYLENRGKEERAARAKAANRREAEIAEQYFNAGPSIGNLARAAYHWYNSVPRLGGQDESGLIIQGGEVPIPTRPTNAIEALERANQMIKASRAARTAKFNEAKETYGLVGNDYLKNLFSARKPKPVKPKNTTVYSQEEAQQLGVNSGENIITGRGGNRWQSSNNYGGTKRRFRMGGNVEKPSSTYVAKPQPKPIYRFQPTIRDLGGSPGRTLTQEDRNKRQRHENNVKAVQDILRGLDNTFGTAISLASILYGGGWAATRLLAGNKATPVGQALAKYVLPANSIDTAADAVGFIGNPSISGALDLGTGLILGRYKDFGKKSRQVGELIGQGANAGNIVFKDGGSIHISPSKRGTFTAAATKHGMGVQEFASRVLRNKEDYSPSLVKKANFARNASKWH